MKKSKLSKIVQTAGIMLGGFFVSIAGAIDIDFSLSQSTHAPSRWVYLSSQVWNAGNSIRVNQARRTKTVVVQAIGGSVTYYVSHGTHTDYSPDIFLPSGAVDTIEFDAEKFNFDNYGTSVTVRSLGTGASAYIRIEHERGVR